MLEKQLERILKNRIEALGCMCLKFESPGYVGVPDRMILIPGGGVVFVEMKAPGERERPRQDYVHGLLRDLGFTVYSSVDSLEKIDEVVKRCRLLSEVATVGCRGRGYTGRIG